MATVAALLAQYQAVKAQISFYTLEQLKWKELHDSMTEKVGNYQGYEEQWNEASEDYCNAHGEQKSKFVKKNTTWMWYSTSNLKINDNSSSMVYQAIYYNGGMQTGGAVQVDLGGKFGKKWCGGDEFGDWVWNGFIGDPVAIAELYADKVCPQFAKDGADKLEEYTNLDMEYEAMQTTYETMLASLRGQEEALKTAVDEGAKDTGMSSGG